MSSDYLWTREHKKTQYCPNCERVVYTVAKRVQERSGVIFVFIQCADCEYRINTVTEQGIHRHG